MQRPEEEDVFIYEDISEINYNEYELFFLHDLLFGCVKKETTCLFIVMHSGAKQNNKLKRIKVNFYLLQHCINAFINHCSH